MKPLAKIDSHDKHAYQTKPKAPAPKTTPGLIKVILALSVLAVVAILLIAYIVSQSGPEVTVVAEKTVASAPRRSVKVPMRRASNTVPQPGP